MNVSGQIQTFDCKVPGCRNEAKANRGSNAYLCDEHIANRPREERRPAPSANGYLEKVKELQVAGRRLDRARASWEAAKTELAEAKADWNQLVDSLPFVEDVTK